jgi:hypothetical protein
MSPRILLFWYLKPWCIKTFPPRLPDINLAGMIINFIYGGGRLIRLFIPKLGMASVNSADIFFSFPKIVKVKMS